MPDRGGFAILYAGQPHDELPCYEAMMSPLQIPVLLRAAPGPLCSALQSLLLSLPQVKAIEAVETPARILELLPAENRLVLVILVVDKGRSAETLPIIQQIRRAAPAARIAILSDDCAEAADDGRPAWMQQVDLVLQQGARPDVLVAGFEKLLSSDQNSQALT